MAKLLESLRTYKYLEPKHLAGFDSYKYNARDTSPLSLYVMHPFWNHLVTYFPRSIAPNTLTFVGFLFTVANFLMLSYYDWSFTASSEPPATATIPAIPNICWLLAAIFIFTAYTLDGIDGKQARRIGLSGPLGELFDHGLDSYTAVLIPTCLFSIFGRGEEWSIPPVRMFYIVWMVYFNFYISHWEKYNTGVLYLPWGYDFSMWGSTLMYLVTWLGQYTFWKQQLPFGISTGLAMEFLLHVSALSSMPMVTYNMWMAYQERTGKMRSCGEAVRPLVPFVTNMVLFLGWAHWSPTGLVDSDPRMMYLLSGTIFSNISCRLIVAQMSNTRCEALHSFTPLLVLAIAGGQQWPQWERTFLYALGLLSTLSHWHYGVRVVDQMCVHFNRICFSVRPAKPSTE